MTVTAYLNARSVAEPPRAVERRLFGQITHQLVVARDQSLSGAALVEVLHRNRTLWNTLSDACATQGNALPAALRAGIISLALWTDRHSSAVATGREPIDDLIEVNRMMIEGLADPAGAPA